MRFALPADAVGTRGVLAVSYTFPVSQRRRRRHAQPAHTGSVRCYALHRVQWQRTIAGYIVEVIEPIATMAVIGLASVTGLAAATRA